MRKILAIALAVLGGVIILADFILQLPWLRSLAARLLEGGLILVCFALILGMLNLTAYHLRRIADHSPGNWQSWVILAALLISLVVSFALPGTGAPSWIYNYLISPILAALGALLVFYGVLAAPRLLLLRNKAAILLFVSFIIFMLLWVPYITSFSPWLSAVRLWLFTVPLGAGMRGILLGAAIGAVVTALRLLFAQERPYTEIAEKR